MNNLFSLSFGELSKLSKSFELDFDKNGYLRTLSRRNNNHSFSSKIPLQEKSINEQTALSIANWFLASSIIKQAFNTQTFTMKVCEIKSFAFGYRIIFKQMVDYNDTVLPVHGGAIHIAINGEGQIFSVSSTLQPGNVVPLRKTAISKRKAISLAKAQCKKAISSSYAQFILASHNNQIEPLYEVTLFSEYLHKVYTYLILANTGQIINESSKKTHYALEKANEGIKAEALLVTPDPEIPIIDQISTIFINDLPDKQILKNAYFEMFTGASANRVRIKDNNTYCYSSLHPEFAAVSVFLSLQKQIELYLSLGLSQPKQPMFVIVDDPFVIDNAHFVPNRYEIHIGVGSGVTNRGLTKHIAYDLSVTNHEFGHAVVFLQVPGGDLIGELGEAINEAIGDVLGALTMDYLGRIWYAKQIGKHFDAEDLKNDLRIIGKYASPPFGIRSQKNSKKFPDDLTGEPHADGLIVGAALADLLVAMATKTSVLEYQIKRFVKLTLMALALLPSYKVTFTDLLRALITADKELHSGKYRAVIEKCFAAHGITLDTMEGFVEIGAPKMLVISG